MLTMDLLATYIPTTLPILLVAHLLALISPGPDFFIVTGHAIRGRFRGSVFICIGISAANAVYIIIAMLGWSAITEQQNLLVIMQIIGATYLIYVGYALIKSDNINLTQRKRIDMLSYSNQLITGFISAILNPKNMLFYFSLTGLLLGDNATPLHKTTATIFMIGMVLGYNLLLVKMISLPTFTTMLQNKLHYFEKVAGGMLLLIALLMLKNMLI